jgi:hypothetical protein
MEKGTQVEMQLDEAVESIIREVDPATLSFYHPSRDFIITDSIMTSDQARKITLD